MELVFLNQKGKSFYLFKIFNLFLRSKLTRLVQTIKSLHMKKLFLAASLVGISMTSFSSPFVDSSSVTVKFDRKKNKKKGHKKAPHKKCEAYNG